MTILSPHEADQFAVASGFANLWDSLDISTPRTYLSFVATGEYGRINLVAETIRDFLLGYSEVLMLYFETDVWEMENSSLCQVFQSQLGVTPEEFKQPLLLSGDEVKLNDAYLLFALFSMWGCLFIPKGGGCSISINHDGFVRVQGDDVVIEPLRKQFSDLGWDV